ncbi:MAG TPA: isocitrate/isopropylmalate family dehydrogenase, partial [Candidatus Tectomicrobia bacterium]|nr:isocitrate/isopropylmalate family dehydrogenase [Candidatus Tectomicrobia bacterium]
MATRAHRIAVVPGDGIGQEVTPEAVRVLEAVAKHEGLTLAFEHGLIGGTAWEQVGDALPEETTRLCLASDAVLFGAVGGPMLDALPRDRRRGLLELRRRMGLFANLRPARAWAPLAAASPLRPDVLQNADLLLVRE